MEQTKEQREYWKKVKDGRCICGALQSEHRGFEGHGDCVKTNCEKFRWKHNVDSRGKKV